MEKIKLKDIIEKNITGEWGTELKDGKEGTYVIRTADFNNDGTINYNKVVKRDIDENKVIDKGLKIGDIIVEKSGGTDRNPVGRVVLFDKKNYECLANNFTQVLRIKEKYYYKYIFYQLFYKYKCGNTLQMFNKTTGIQNLKMKTYLEQLLIVPKIEEQIKIADKLDKIREIINIREKQIEELNLLIKNQFREMFENKDIEKQSLEYLCNEIFAGGDVPKDRYSKIKTNKYTIPIYSNGEKENGLYGYTDKSKVDRPSITISARGTIGYCVIRNEPFYPVIRLITIIPDITRLNIVFLKYALSNIKMYSGTSIPQLTVPTVKKHYILVPSLELQNQFANIVNTINEQKTKLQKSLAEMQNLQASLMNKYFEEN